MIKQVSHIDEPPGQVLCKSLSSKIMTIEPPQDGKRHPLNMRTTKELREKIERAAAQSGRSLVQEVEFRLERSFWEDEVRGGLTLPCIQHGV